MDGKQKNCDKKSYFHSGEKTLKIRTFYVFKRIACMRQIFHVVRRFLFALSQGVLYHKVCIPSAHKEIKLMINIVLLSFFAYLLIIVTIGIAATMFHARTSSSALLTGDRSINWWVTAISAHAADMSDWLFMGLPAAIYTQGVFNAWVAIGLVIGMFCAWHFLAPALVSSAATYKTKTVISFFELKYKETTGRISLLSAAIMAFFFTIYIAAGIKGVGYLLSSTFGLESTVGGLLTLAVTLIYTLLGGFVAAAWVDFFQGIFLLCALIITTVFGLFYSGGFSSLVAAAQIKEVSLSLFPENSSIFAIVTGPLAWGLGYFGMPHVLSKFMGAKDVKQLYKSKYVGITWQVIALFSAVLVGLVAIPFFKQTLSNPETLFIAMTLQIFPAAISGLILCGILSATLSTMNAQMIVFAGIVADGLYKKLYDPHASKRAIVTVFRVSIVLVACIAFVISWFDKGTIFNLVQFAWGGLGASFGPLALISLVNVPSNRHGAFFGMLAGGTTAIAWKLFGATITGMTMNELLPGFFVGLIVIYVVSVLTSNTRPSVSA